MMSFKTSMDRGLFDGKNKEFDDNKSWSYATASGEWYNSRKDHVHHDATLFGFGLSNIFRCGT